MSQGEPIRAVVMTWANGLHVLDTREFDSVAASAVWAVRRESELVGDTPHGIVMTAHLGGTGEVDYDLLVEMYGDALREACASRVRKRRHQAKRSHRRRRPR